MWLHPGKTEERLHDSVLDFSYCLRRSNSRNTLLTWHGRTDSLPVQCRAVKSLFAYDYVNSGHARQIPGPELFICWSLGKKRILLSWRQGHRRDVQQPRAVDLLLWHKRGPDGSGQQNVRWSNIFSDDRTHNKQPAILMLPSALIQRLRSDNWSDDADGKGSQNNNGEDESAVGWERRLGGEGERRWGGERREMVGVSEGGRPGGKEREGRG